MVIECKASHVTLDEIANIQMVDYADKLLCSYAVLTNGYTTFVYEYDTENDKYIRLAGLPKYENMMCNKYDILEEATFLERTPYEKLEEMLAEYVGLDIGSSTPISKKILILNIWEYTTDNGEDFKQCLNKFICRGIGIIYETAKTQLNRKTKRWLTV